MCVCGFVISRRRKSYSSSSKEEVQRYFVLYEVEQSCGPDWSPTWGVGKHKARDNNLTKKDNWNDYFVLVVDLWESGWVGQASKDKKRQGAQGKHTLDYCW